MTVSSISGYAAGVGRPKAKLGTKSRRRRQIAFESLESRVVLSYAFAYDAFTKVATAVGDAAVDSLVLEPVGGFLEHSVNGGPFSAAWGRLAVPADPTVTVDISISSGNGSSLQLGTPTGPASQLLASFDTSIPSNTSDTLTIDDSQGTSLASLTQPYSIDTGSTFTISGPGLSYHESGGSFDGGVTLEGSAINGNIYDVSSTFTSEAVTVVTAAGTTSTVNVGNAAGTVSSIFGPLSIYDPGDGTTVNINDQNDKTSSTATLDLSGDPNAPYEVTGLSPGPIKYGAGVTALNINGGTFGASGFTYNINDTQAVTTTTINGGPAQNFINLSNAVEAGGLGNLPGPVVVHGGLSLADVVTLDDSSANFNDTYNFTNTTVTRNLPFGGLTYDDNIGTLTLDAENTLGTNGNNTININSTADRVTTNVHGQGGVDTITVSNSGLLGVLNIDTGVVDGNTVNVVAANEPVNVSNHALSTVNIGSTGGAGSMAGIQGPISVVNSISGTALNFHDENDTTGQTWTLDNNDSVPTGSVAVTGSATTTYNPVDLAELTVNGGSGGNTFNVINTTALAPTTLNTGTGADTVNVFHTGDATLAINGQGGSDTVTLGALATAPFGMQGLNGMINVTNDLGVTTLILNDSTDPKGQIASLTTTGTTGDVSGLSPATITYSDTEISGLTVDGGSGGNTFNISSAGLAAGPHYLFDGGSGNNNTLNFDSAGQLVDFTASTITLNGVVINYVNFQTVNALTVDVINTNDSGTGSLRHAIIDANGHPGRDTLIFRIPGTGPFLIAPITPLPAITDPVVIDGYNQAGARPNTLPNGDNAVLKIELNGASAPAGSDGLLINANGSTVEGLAINRFGGDGVAITGSGATNNTVQGNFIGTDVSGVVALGSSGSGLSIFSSNNTIGGLSPAARNLISGNGLDGVDLTNAAATGNLVEGNFIGTDATGADKLGNARLGVAVTSVVNSGSPSGSDNTIGGTAVGAGNVISGNGRFGVVVFGPYGGATGNVVQGNFIGTDSSGEHSLGNVDGVVLSSAASNTVGGADVSARNVIAGSGRYGVVIESQKSTGNLVEGNLIGTDKSGVSALGNALDGVLIQLGASSNTVGGVASGAGNLISGNLGNGVQITDAGTAGNLVAGNRIGINADGNAPLPNQQDGVLIAASAIGNTVGAPASGAGNLISGNLKNGVKMTGAGTTNNLVEGNFIGTSRSGTARLGNSADGILLDNASSNSITRNVVSGNGIGQDAAGIDLIQNARDNTIAGNMIGTDAGGAAALGNSLVGISVGDGSSNNTLGPNNVISGNGTGGNKGIGVYIFDSNTSGNVLLGDSIGTNKDGTRAIASSAIGVLINEASGTIVQSNVISGNLVIGIEIAGATASGNVLQGNLIGTNKAGTAAISDGVDGIFVNNAPGNTIGGTTKPDGNLVSGNSQVGIQIFGFGARKNLIQNNILGRDRSGVVRAGLLNGNANDLGVYVNTTPGVNTIIGNIGQGARESPTGAPFNPIDPGSNNRASTRVFLRGKHARPFYHRLFFRASNRPAFYGGRTG